MLQCSCLLEVTSCRDVRQNSAEEIASGTVFESLLFLLIAVSTSDAGLLARSQYSEGPATGHIDKGFSWFPCVYKQMLRS